DVDGISHVINYDLPNIPESYVPRIGRTARAGADGIAISFCDNEEVAFLRDIEKLIQIKLPSEERRSAPRNDMRPVHQQNHGRNGRNGNRRNGQQQRRSNGGGNGHAGQQQRRKQKGHQSRPPGGKSKSPEGQTTSGGGKRQAPG